MLRSLAVAAAIAVFASACATPTDSPTAASDSPGTSSDSPAAPSDADGVVEVAATPQQIGDHAARVTGELGGPEAFARTWWAVDRGYGVDQIVGSDIGEDGSIEGVSPSGQPLGMLAAPVALGSGGRVLAAPAAPALAGPTGFDGDSRAQQQYLEDVEATMAELYKHAEQVVQRAEEGPELPAEVRATGTVTLVLIMLSLGHRGPRIVEAIVFGELEGRREAPDVIPQDRNLDTQIARILGFACIAQVGESAGRSAWRERHCDGEEPRLDAQQPPADDPAPAAVAWAGTLPHSPLGVFQSGTVVTNEVVVEVAEEVAQATIVYELEDIPVFTEAGEVFCSADLLFVFEFAPLPVDDPDAFELLGRLEFLEANRRGSDCSRASPPESGEQPATALFTTDTTDAALAHLELRVAGQDVYDQPIQLTFG